MSISNSGISSSCKNSNTQKLEPLVDIPLLLYCPHFILFLLVLQTLLFHVGFLPFSRSHSGKAVHAPEPSHSGKKGCKAVIQDVMQHGRGFRNEILALWCISCWSVEI